MTVLGPLAGEAPELKTESEFENVRALRTSWIGTVSLEKKIVKTLLDEIIWQKSVSSE